MGDIEGQTVIEGTYILTATESNELALAPRAQSHTAFTGALLEVLRGGIEGGSEYLTCESIYRAVRRLLVSRGLPKPRQAGSDTVHALALVRNVKSEHTNTAPKRQTPVYGNLREDIYFGNTEDFELVRQESAYWPRLPSGGLDLGRVTESAESTGTRANDGEDARNLDASVAPSWSRQKIDYASPLGQPSLSAAEPDADAESDPEDHRLDAVSSPPPRPAASHDFPFLDSPFPAGRDAESRPLVAKTIGGHDYKWWEISERRMERIERWVKASHYFGGLLSWVALLCMAAAAKARRFALLGMVHAVCWLLLILLCLRFAQDSKPLWLEMLWLASWGMAALHVFLEFHGWQKNCSRILSERSG